MALALSFPLATALTATTFVHGPRVTHPLALAHRARRSTDVVSTIAVFGASGRTGSEVVLQAMERGEKVSCLVRDRTRLKAPRDSAALGCRAGSMNNFTPTMNEQMARTEGTVLSLGLGLSLGLSLSLSLGLRLRLRLRLSQSLSLSLGLSLSLSLRLRLRLTLSLCLTLSLSLSLSLTLSVTLSLSLTLTRCSTVQMWTPSSRIRTSRV